MRLEEDFFFVDVFGLCIDSPDMPGYPMDDLPPYEARREIRDVDDYPFFECLAPITCFIMIF